MKNTLIRLIAFMAFAYCTFSFAAAQNNNNNGNTDNQLIGRATGAFNGGCAGPAIGPLNGAVEIIGSCFNGGFIKRVLFFRQVNCHQVDCNAIRFAPVGYVDFDCEGNVIGVSCTWP